MSSTSTEDIQKQDFQKSDSHKPQYNIIYDDIKKLQRYLKSCDFGSVSVEYFRKTLFYKSGSYEGSRIIEAIPDLKAFTSIQMQTETGLMGRLVDHHLKDLTEIGALDVVSEIYDKRLGKRRPTRIYAIPGTGPEEVNEARKWYMEHNRQIEPVTRSERVIIHALSREGQGAAELWINYYIKRDFLDLSRDKRDKLLSELRKDHPSMSLEERQAIVKHVFRQVTAHRETSQ